MPTTRTQPSCFVEFLLSEEGSDIFVEGEAVYSLRSGYTPPAAAAPYLLDLSKAKLLGMSDWVGAQKDFKTVRETLAGKLPVGL